MGLFDIFRRRKSGTASPSPDSKRGDWMKWFLNREALGGMKFNPGPGGYIDYSPFFQRGGSVNPHEETRQAAQNWSPREQYISRSNQDRMHDATVNRFVQESQGDQQRWEQGGGQGPYPVFNEPGTGANFPVSPGWLEASSGRDNSGIMMADAGNIMNKYKQFTDTFGDFDLGRGGIEYEKDFDVPFGGTGTFEGWGGGDDYGVGINFNWPLGQSAALDDRGGNWLSRIGGALKDEFGGSAMAKDIGETQYDWNVLEGQDSVGEGYSPSELRELGLSGSDLGALADEDHTLGIEPPTYPSKWKPWTWFNRGGIASLR